MGSNNTNMKYKNKVRNYTIITFNKYYQHCSLEVNILFDLVENYCSTKWTDLVMKRNSHENYVNGWVPFKMTVSYHAWGLKSNNYVAFYGEKVEWNYPRQ